MKYLYGAQANYEDYASGRVLFGARGMPNFPVRLMIELFGRALDCLDKKEHILVYDPCCGTAYSLTVLGFFYGEQIEKIYASDISADMVSFASKNLGLLSIPGLERRKEDLEKLFAEYGKASHQEAVESAARLREKLIFEVKTEVFEADCTKPLPDIRPDLIITDIPYGNLVDWEGDGGLGAMLEQLWRISKSETILAISMDKDQKLLSDRWKRIEKQNIGKRRFELLKRSYGDVYDYERK